MLPRGGEKVKRGLACLVNKKFVKKCERMDGVTEKIKDTHR